MSGGVGTEMQRAGRVDAPPALEVRALEAGYGRSRVLHGLTFSVRAGESVSLIGRNGMGKTTTLKAIMGLIRPSAGEVSIAGRSMAGAPPHAVAQAGAAYVPEERGIFPNLSVRENLVMAARPGAGGTGWTLERVLELFPSLTERLDHWGDRLSGGEQQMLTIGRALMTNPRLLLLDEATEGLAPLVRDEIWRVIREIRRAGIACVVVDKNIGKLLEVADRHVLLVKGRVVFNGDGAALVADPDRLHRDLGV
ncbi:MAG: ABC transporter ATP-binding protein [Rhodovibrionaceae bacterium]|nr:ABC transporter ATP-binding protein [Rhodovibrionaceae bacterium]